MSCSRLPTVDALALLLTGLFPLAVGGCGGDDALAGQGDAQSHCTPGGPDCDAGTDGVAPDATSDTAMEAGDGANDACCSEAGVGSGWSGILASSRAIDWSQAGLPPTFPDGETTPNPWTPPTRKLCTTVNPAGSSADTANINNAIAGCAAGTYVLLGAGTFQLTGNIQLYQHNHVTLRGSGATSTVLKGGYINIGAGSGEGYARLTSDSSNFVRGTTSVITSGAAPPVGTLVWLTQCDTGYSALDGTFTNVTPTNPCTGAHVDNGALYICGLDGVCDTNGAPPDSNPHSQSQYLFVNSVTDNGNGTSTVHFSGLYMQNWSYGNTATLAWQDASYVAIGNGLEDVTVDGTGVGLEAAYGSWVKGVRIVNTVESGDGILQVRRSKNCLVANNYIYANTTPPSYAAYVMAIIQGSDSDDLILNNIIQDGFVEGGGSDEGVVFAYNYLRDTQTDYPNNSDFQHQAGSAFILREGNQMGASRDDATWGTHTLNTWFRNYLACGDPPYAGGMTNLHALIVDSLARFENVIGNALGSSACAQYENGHFPWVFGINVGGGNANLTDSTGLTESSLMRWGNYAQCTSDSTGGNHCNATSWCGNASSPGWSTTCNSKSDVPTSLTGNAAPFANPVPANTNLSASFFMPGMTAHPKGGTGLSWWKVCTSWTTFPTSCATSQSQPFPAIGPDVSGGPNINGFAHDISAAVAYKALPIDTSYQSSYSITGSSWSGGVETLTVSGLPSSLTHIMGGFQLTGAPAGCNASGGELVMTASSTTSISYALASDPGASCTGTVKWPDVRQFDERVYQNDL